MKFSKETCVNEYTKGSMARQLEGKSEPEIYSILTRNNVVCMKPYATPNYPRYYRALYILLAIVFVPFCSIKWVITGHYELDMLAKKYSFFRYVLKVAKSIS